MVVTSLFGTVELNELALEPVTFLADLEADPGRGVDGVSGATSTDISLCSSGRDQASGHAQAEGDAQCQTSDHVSPGADREIFSGGWRWAP
jgi:hypothetical protein